jgi:nucleoside-diphosphate-sugar epimerase
MRVFVTGATGMVGAHAARALLEAGHGVRALVRDTDKASRVLEPLGVAPEDFVRGDMTDAAVIGAGIEDCDAVLHAAGSVAVTTGGKGVETNVTGARVVVGEAAQRGLHCVYVSSLQALMEPGRTVTELTPPAGGKTPYSRSKAEADQWVRNALSRGKPISIVYPSGVLGPDDPGWSETVKAYRDFLRGTLKVGALQMVDARDLARLLVRALESRHSGVLLAAGHYYTFDQLTSMLEQVTGAEIPRIPGSGWMLRSLARGLDVIGRLTGRSMPMTGEGIAIATLWQRVEDSKAVAELGVEWRPPEETLADVFRWYVDRSRLSASAVPKIKAPA